jgi:CheY-like chemotaxis protein
VFQTEWPILLVDDDQDVLAISRLAMKNFVVDGIPVKLHTATSKAEAINLLDTTLSGSMIPYITVAFIDVVMENDQAGLELCRYIRETTRNKLTQIYIRTGQPGVAPEREVIDRFDINGYFSKSETTEDKLYSLVKAGVRQFDFASMALLEFEVVTRAIAASDSLDHLKRMLYDVLSRVPLDAQGNPSNAQSYNPRVSMLIGDHLLAGTIPEAESVAIRDRLLSRGLQPLTPNGDGYATDGEEHLIKVAATDAYDEASHVAQFPAKPSMGDTLVLLNFTKSIAALAKRAGAVSREPVAAR